jgi:hypothetical protein
MPLSLQVSISEARAANVLLDAEADRLCNAQRYERSEPGRIREPTLRTQSAIQGRRGP